MSENTPAPADLVEALPFTRLQADYIPVGSDTGEAGWQIHDLPDHPSHCAYWICGGLEESEAKFICEAVNSHIAHRRATAIGKVEITESQSEALHRALIASCDEFAPPQPDPRDAEIERLKAEVGQLSAMRAVLVARQEMQEVPNLSGHHTKGANSAYRPAIGETCLVSGPNCDDANGYVFAEMDILWASEIFVLYGRAGYWPNLNRWEHVWCKPLTALAKSEVKP